MKPWPAARMAAWVFLAGGLTTIGWAAITPIHGGVALSPPQREALDPSVLPYPADSMIRVVVSGDLFRAGRRPAERVYDPVPGAMAAPTDAPPKPQLALVGIVSGAAPSAVIEGFPGVEGSRVVRVGDVVAGLRVKSIGTHNVRIAGMDTVWTLTVREPWR
ncbi:MAG: hypothetical protein ACREMW_00035 [Gemmatimonadales bacterium]